MLSPIYGRAIGRYYFKELKDYQLALVIQLDFSMNTHVSHVGSYSQHVGPSSVGRFLIRVDKAQTSTTIDLNNKIPTHTAFY